MAKDFKNKIEASDTTISNLLKNEKFYIDYFQREYRWQEKHIKLLVEDLTSTFLKSYKPEDKPTEVENYQTYYLGPVVFSNTDGKKSIIDGQQRITSITLILIYLNHQQKSIEEDERVAISDLIFSVKHRVKSFNMTDETREQCLKGLYEDGEYTPTEEDDETVVNMTNRYEDISEVFPEEIDDKALPYFIDWFTDNVVIVEITAYSDENAYTIFETMNDRGLNLTQTEMLKGFVLSKIDDKKRRSEINELWKVQIKKLHELDTYADIKFFQAWFRGKYATSIRPGKAGSKNQDFELIGSQFHNWFKDNHRGIFHLDTSDKFYAFFKNQFPFFIDWYIKLWNAEVSYDTKLPHMNYIHYWGIAESLQDPLLLSAIEYGDSEESALRKIDFVSRFIETFTVRRAANYKKFGQTSIKYTMFNLIKKVRNNSVESLSENLIGEIESIEQNWDGIFNLRLHGQNRRFIKHLLSRITTYVDSLAAKDNTYVTFHHPKGKQFEIEHIWGNKFEEHREEFEQENEFQYWRNSIGALILLPNGTNQSFSSDKYEHKLEHYIKENTYAQSLHPLCYQKNPNFVNNKVVQDFNFKPHADYLKQDISDRLTLVKQICEEIWSVDYYRI